MNIALPLDRMTTAEKLETMELIWTDLTRDQEKFDSPAWHQQALRERDAALREGREIPLDWDTAKQRLRELRA